MSEYWKSTPNYWCKYCSRYVRDTKLERAAHERTLTHQNSLKRELRELHRNHERSERDKERAQAEVERLNHLVGGGGGGADKRSSSAAATSGGAQQRQASSSSSSSSSAAAARQAQMEQLAMLGVQLPGEARGEVAMPGEWTVVSTRVVEDEGKATVAGRAVGVRKRELTEEEREVAAAEREMARPRKKNRGWGPKAVQEGDAELDALLSGVTASKEPAGAKKEHDEGEVKKEEEDETEEGRVETVKKEEGDVNTEVEPGEDSSLPAPTSSEAAGDKAAPVPMFKKRKAKIIRQK
jgi:hypothetical protein